MSHVSHCCVRHGCKYGGDECPVVHGRERQQFLCEECTDDAREDAKRSKLGVFRVYGEFADGRFWPDGSPSYTSRNALVVARDQDDAWALAIRKYGKPDPEDESGSIERVPLRRGVYGEP